MNVIGTGGRGSRGLPTAPRAAFTGQWLPPPRNSPGSVIPAAARIQVSLSKQWHRNKRWIRAFAQMKAAPRLLAALLIFSQALGTIATAAAQTVDTTRDSIMPGFPASEDSAKGHGTISLGYQNSFVNGARKDHGPKAEIGTVRIQSLNLAIDYNLSERWELHAAIPFVKSRYRGTKPHCPTSAPPQCAGMPVLTHPHPESQFLDDGAWHGTWQDYELGIAWHGNIGSYLITPSLTALIPSHDYVTFAQAAVGQNLNKLAVGIALAHQFEASNFFYQVGYARVFVEETLGHNVDHNRYELALGYTVSPDLTIGTFAQAKLGRGVKFSQGPLLYAGNTNELFFHHDQINAYEYANVGFSLDYRLGERYTLSSALQRLVWGNTVFNTKYTLDLRLTRSF